MLRVEGLKGGYENADEIIKGVSLAVEPGELVTIIGPNGAGKSTALKLISGLLKTGAGSIRLGGEEIAALSPQERARRGVVFVPQEQNVFASLKVWENLDIAAFLEPAGSRQRAEKIYERFPVIAERRHAYAGSLSGGQRQTLAMAIAMMASPRVLLLDEPTAALAPRAADEIFGCARSIADDGIAVLMVEQNALAALARSDRGLIMVDGRIVSGGPAAEMLADPEIGRTFLGSRA